MKTLFYSVENEQDKNSNDRKWFDVILSGLHLMFNKHATFAISSLFTQFMLSQYEIEWLFLKQKGEHWQFSCVSG